jgi:hypothetical protein
MPEVNTGLAHACKVRFSVTSRGRPAGKRLKLPPRFSGKCSSALKTEPCHAIRNPVSRHSLRQKSERSFRLQNLAANLPARICDCVEIEISLTTRQLFSLPRCQGCHTINGTWYLAPPFHSNVAGRVSNRKLWLRIRPRRRWSMKVCRDNWTSHSTELNVIFELVGFSIQRGGHSSSTRAVVGRNLG